MKSLQQKQTWDIEILATHFKTTKTAVRLHIKDEAILNLTMCDRKEKNSYNFRNNDLQMS